MQNPTRSALFLALSISFAGCAPSVKNDISVAVASVPAASPHFIIDESQLPHLDAPSFDQFDTGKDACGDLFGYVNGKWLAANPIPPDQMYWGGAAVFVERSLAIRHQIAEQSAANTAATGVEKIIGDFYATGMDTAAINAQGMTPIEPRLSEIDQLRSSADVARYLRSASARGQGFVFNFAPHSDLKNSNNVIAYLDQGELGLPDRGYYFDADKREQLAAYADHVAKVLVLSGVAEETARADARAIIAFETRLAKVSRTAEENNDWSFYYNPVSPAAADALTPNFSWTEFFKSQGMAVPAMFSLAMPEFQKEFDRMLVDVPVDQWRAYLRFREVDRASPYLSEPFVAENFAFYSNVMRGQKEMKANWKRVLATIEAESGEAMGQLYVSVAFPENSKREMEKLIVDFETALKKRLERLAWMSAPTKAKALQKLAAFEVKVGYPDTWRDWRGLQTSRASYYGNVLVAEAFNRRWETAKIGKPVDRAEWGTTPQTVNAYYDPTKNDLTFPAAILQPPAFDPNDGAVDNYARIGAIIGHEMIHGYDGQGSNFGPTGNLENWWTAEDAKQFDTRTSKLVQQFDLYEAMPGVHVNGKLTIGENIADLGGFNIAYDAMKMATAGTSDPMKDGLTRDQWFFLNFAAIWRDQYAPAYQKMMLATNNHAPAQFRAIASPSNMPAFAKAFGCKPGDAMWRDPADAVSIW